MKKNSVKRIIYNHPYLPRNTGAHTSELGPFNTQRPHADGIKKLKTDTVLNDVTSEIERDLCAFDSIGGSQLLSNSPLRCGWTHFICCIPGNCMSKMCKNM